MRLRVATRRSALALTQTRMVARALEAATPGLVVEEVPLVTEGDRVQDRSLAAIGGKGLFVKELEAALLDGRADLAVHSMKDVPAELAPGLAIGAVPPRESPFDLLITRDGAALTDLPRGARVGSSSLRRAIQLRAIRDDLVVEVLRGNVDTRLRRLGDGAFDAIVLAEAGVRRLGLEVRAQRLEGIVVPAIGQGALALEVRDGDAATREVVAGIDDGATHAATRAERAVLRALTGDCTTPMGALAVVEAGRIAMRGFYASADGARRATAQAEGGEGEPEAVGAALAARLRAALG